MTTDAEFENLVRQAATLTVLEQPTAEQCARILERRARGERVSLPVQPSARRRSWGPRITALAAIAAGLGTIVVASLRSPARQGDEGRPRPAPSLLAPDVLLAQTTSHPVFPVLSAPSRPLRAGSWIYTAEIPDEIRPWDVLFTYRLIPSHYEGSAAWLLLAGRQAPESDPVVSDSTWVAREGLLVLAHRRDTTLRWQPVPSLFLAVLQAAELSADWSASVPLLRDGTDSVAVRQWVNLKVYGTETVDVPAGRFTCWKIGFTPNAGFYFWISTDGWPVRQGMDPPENRAFGKINLLLVRHEEP
jgi:hypothetical protein